MLRNHEKNIIVVSKVKTKLLIHIPNCKLNRIIDRTYRPFNVFPRTNKTYSTSLKNPEIPVFQQFIMKNDIVFQFFQQKLKNGSFSSKSRISSNCNNPGIYGRTLTVYSGPAKFGSHMYFGSGYMIFVCHVILHDHVII